MTNFNRLTHQNFYNTQRHFVRMHLFTMLQHAYMEINVQNRS